MLRWLIHALPTQHCVHFICLVYVFKHRKSTMYKLSVSHFPQNVHIVIYAYLNSTLVTLPRVVIQKIHVNTNSYDDSIAIFTNDVLNLKEWLISMHRKLNQFQMERISHKMVGIYEVACFALKKSDTKWLFWIEENFFWRFKVTKQVKHHCPFYELNHENSNKALSKFPYLNNLETVKWREWKETGEFCVKFERNMRYILLTCPLWKYIQSLLLYFKLLVSSSHNTKSS